MSNAERRVRIFIGVPCYGTVAPEVLDDWMGFMFYCGRRLPQYDFFSGVRTKSEQFRARNALVEAAISVGADYLFMLDDDMIIDPFDTKKANDSFALLDRLIKHDKDIVGALYYQRTGNFMPVAMAKTSEHGYRFLRDDELTRGLQRVDVAGGGALLIRMRVFDKIAQPWFAPEHEFGTDVQLCRAATAKGFEVWLDSSVELGHVRDERVIITSRNKGRYQMEVGIPGEVTKQVVNSDVFNRLLGDAIEWTGFKSIQEMTIAGQRFMTDSRWEAFHEDGGDDTEWYRQYPKERVARQVWFNTASVSKRQMTEYILATIGDEIPANILDFGCGIGIPAFELAKRGHRVTALDIAGTGTLQFLEWRAKKHNVPLTFHKSDGGVPELGDARFAAIVVMDCLEHIPEWRTVLADLASRLETNGVLFSNNGILDDDVHPEHYPLSNTDFYAECVKNNLLPISQIAFIKRGMKTPV